MEVGHLGQDQQEELKGPLGHRMELWLPGRACGGGRMGADGEQAAGPSTGKTVCSKKLNKSSSLRVRGAGTPGAHRGKAAVFSKMGALWRARSRGGGSRSLLTSQGCSGSRQDEDLVSTSQALPPLCPSKAIGLLGWAGYQPQARKGQRGPGGIPLGSHLSWRRARCIWALSGCSTRNSSGHRDSST